MSRLEPSVAHSCQVHYLATGGGGSGGWGTGAAAALSPYLPRNLLVCWSQDVKFKLYKANIPTFWFQRLNFY